MISGDTNVKYLNDNGVTIWNEWADEDGNLGPVYGRQWRRWNIYENEGWSDYSKFEIDQLQNAIDLLKTDPDSRRIIVNTWNVADLNDMALTPCHMAFQFYSRPDGDKRYLSCHMYQRSADAFLGVPFNIASYALLTHMVAQITNHEVDELVVSFGDVHIYMNHVPQAFEQLKRSPYPRPKVRLNLDIQNIDDFKYKDILLIDYKSHPKIKAEISV